MKFNIAISVIENDNWIAREIEERLKDYSIDVFYYKEKKDVRGVLLKKLEKIYKYSFLDIIILSKKYLNSKSKYLIKEKNVLIKKYKNSKKFPIIIGFNYKEKDYLYFNNNDFFKFIKKYEILDIKTVSFTDIVKVILDTLMNNHFLYNENYGTFFHPFGVSNRITIDMISFKINRNYKNDKLNKWNTLGDILVDIMDYKHRLNMYTYLIPSGNVIPFLSNSIFLKTNNKALKLKKELSKEFIENFKNKTLIGVLIYIIKNDMAFPFVYCNEYDNFLNKYYFNFYKKILFKE